ncbi:hypothetical protein [Anaeromicropila populeti]|uniref:Uncharacterized protein n=1 Tax=Anaeromicropila populeti TaxID=37658 RepID=A0A1I6JEW6_9FIRM|nr:hypothetical protein [Anaeromicropila populeti]SFR77511.1 hypothetical protein SAMN05661086_01625 [Anaeromicropila populeti]
MQENTKELFQNVIRMSNVELEEEYKQIAAFNHVFLGAKESLDSSSGFSFCIVEKDSEGNTIFYHCTEEFQNANTCFLLRSNLALPREMEYEYEQEPG